MRILAEVAAGARQTQADLSSWGPAPVFLSLHTGTNWWIL